MQYLVILDPASTIGKIYSENYDAISNTNGLKCPLLACTEISFDNPYYIFVERGGNQAKAKQSLYLPYHSVVAILQQSAGETRPIGFAPPAFPPAV